MVQPENDIPVRTRLVPAFSEGSGETHTFDVAGHGNAGDISERGKEIDVAEQTVAGPAPDDPAARPAQDEGDPGTRVVHRPLGARQFRTVIGHEKDEGILGQPVLLQRIEDRLDRFVHSPE